MNVAGIVAEYNPFHRGHEYHILKTREILKEDSLIVCVMSGDFVQRGEPAAYSKYVRAEAACRCGVDLVFELPLPWSLATAESFAEGAVSILNGVGCTHLSFGSESGNMETLKILANSLNKPEILAEIEALLAFDPSLGYAQARQRAAASIIGAEAKLLSKPNNILAVEYLKAINRNAYLLKPITIKRCGSEHDGSGGELRSAAELRRMMAQGVDITPCIPEEAACVYAQADGEGRGHPDKKLLETAMLARLRFLSEKDFESLPGAEGGLGLRLFRAAMTESSLQGVIDRAKTKRYTDSRIRRMLCCAALGIDAEIGDGLPPYARVLAVNNRGRDYLSRIRGKTDLPIITKTAAVRKLGPYAEKIVSIDAKAHDLFALGFAADHMRRGDADWRTGPAIL